MTKQIYIEKKQQRKERTGLAILLISLIALSVLSLFIGVTDMSLKDVFIHGDSNERFVFITSRIPRLISILVVGAGLSVAGVVMQQLTANRFASPSTTGTMESAKLGVLVSITLFSQAGLFVKMTIAFAFALLGTFIFMQVISRIKLKDTIFIPLIGIMFGGIISAVTTFIAYQNDLIQNIDSWLQGSFALVIKGRYELLYTGIPILIVVYLYARQFTIAGLGKDTSSSLGVNYQSVVNLGLVLCALVTSLVVVTIGTISFIGVIIPNIVSIYMGDNLKRSLPYTAALGAVYVLVCDILGRLILSPFELPISVTAGTIGSIIFILLMLGRKNYGTSIA